MIKKIKSHPVDDLVQRDHQPFSSKSLAGKIKNQKKVSSEDEVALLKSQLVRTLADYDNLRKRVDSEREVWIKFSSERVITQLLPVVDILESAQNHLGDQGLAIGIIEFKKILNEEGIQEVKPNVGDEFNPELHEATEAVDGGKKGEVVELVLAGWKFSDGKIIRHAKVKVYK